MVRLSPAIVAGLTALSTYLRNQAAQWSHANCVEAAGMPEHEKDELEPPNVERLAGSGFSVGGVGYPVYVVPELDNIGVTNASESALACRSSENDRGSRRTMVRLLSTSFASVDHGLGVRLGSGDNHPGAGSLGEHDLGGLEDGFVIIDRSDAVGTEVWSSSGRKVSCITDSLAKRTS